MIKDKSRSWALGIYYRKHYGEGSGLWRHVPLEQAQTIGGPGGGAQWEEETLAKWSWHQLYAFCVFCMKSDDETTVARNGNGTGTPLRAPPSGWCWVVWLGGERTFWEAQGPQVNSQNPHTRKKTHSTMLSSDLCVCVPYTHTHL